MRPSITFKEFLKWSNDWNNFHKVIRAEMRKDKINKLYENRNKK